MTKREFRCGISVCDAVAAAMSLSPEAVAAVPDAWKFCPEHLAMKLGVAAPKVPKRSRMAHPAFTGTAEPSCYGLAGKCTNQGILYPGGIFCAQCAPGKIAEVCGKIG